MNDSLKPCTKCGSPIALEAWTCPKCGGLGHGQIQTNKDIESFFGIESFFWKMAILVAIDFIWLEGKVSMLVINAVLSQFK